MNCALCDLEGFSSRATGYLKSSVDPDTMILAMACEDHILGYLSDPTTTVKRL